MTVIEWGYRISRLLGTGWRKKKKKTDKTLNKNGVSRKIGMNETMLKRWLLSLNERKEDRGDNSCSCLDK